MLLLGLDVETTGLEASSDRIIEIGAVLWDTERSQPVKIFSEMIREPDVEAISPLIEDITGINYPMLQQFGLIPSSGLFQTLQWYMDRATYFVAHNAPFDREFLREFFLRHQEVMPEKPWIDTIQDVPYPKKFKGRALTYLAAEHGFINPFPHRAVTDVMTMLKVLSHYDVELIAESAESPTLELTAMVSYDDRDKAKDAGFRWDGGDKKWKMKIKKPAFKPEDFEFKVEVVELG